MADSFTLFGPARWTPADGSRTFALALVQNDVTHERRLVERKRPYVDGAPFDDSGSDAKPLTLRAIFVNGHGVAGVPDPAYPQYHRDFLDALEQKGKGTSTLYSPGRGEKRVRYKRYTTSQGVDRRDVEFVDLLFFEETEDQRATAASFTLPSAKSAGPVLARQLLDTGHKLGIGGDLFDAILAAANRLASAASAPFDSAAAMQQRAAELLGLLDRAERNLVYGPRRFGGDSFSPLSPADAVEIVTGLRVLRDVARRHASATYGEGSVGPVRFPVVLSIFDIAAKLGQDPNELASLNVRRVPSLFAIPAGFPVLVRAAA